MVASRGSGPCSTSGRSFRGSTGRATTRSGTGSPPRDTTYTRRRKAHFGELNTRRDEAKSSKEALLVEAEGLAGSTDWAETGKRMRTLMDQWKAAGGAAREVDEQLWQRFRAAQDSFFAARTAYFAAQDEEFAENAKVKESLLQEAERLLPVRNIGEAKRQLRALQDRWNAVGKVPRDSMRPLEQRMRAVEHGGRRGGIGSVAAQQPGDEGEGRVDGRDAARVGRGPGASARGGSGVGRRAQGVGRGGVARRTPQLARRGRAGAVGLLRLTRSPRREATNPR